MISWSAWYPNFEYSPFEPSWRGKWVLYEDGSILGSNVYPMGGSDVRAVYNGSLRACVRRATLADLARDYLRFEQMKEREYVRRTFGFWSFDGDDRTTFEAWLLNRDPDRSYDEIGADDGIPF